MTDIDQKQRVPEEPVTQKQLADLLGLSQATVSRALRNDHRIPDVTIKRVLKKAEELGYRPAPIISSWASRTHSRALEMRDCPIAYLCGNMKGPGVHELRLLREMAYPRGFKIIEVNTEHFPDGPSLAKYLFQLGVVGIIIGSSKYDEPWLKNFNWSRYAVISMESRLFDLPVPMLRPALSDTVSRLYEIAWERGYRRIGVTNLRHPAHHPDDDIRLGMFLAVQAKHLGEPDLASVYNFFPLEWDVVVPPFYEWLERYRPDMVIGFNTVQYWWLHKAPKPFRDMPFAAQCVWGLNPEKWGIAGLEDNWPEIIRLAVQWLENAIRLRQYGLMETCIKTVVPAVWRDGPSLPLASRGA